MSWTAGKKSDDIPASSGDAGEIPDHIPKPSGEKVDFYEDLSETYLPKLPAFNKSYAPLFKDNVEESVEDAKRLKGLHILIFKLIIVISIFHHPLSNEYIN